MSQPEWESLAAELADLRSRVIHLEAVMGLPAHAAPAGTAPLNVLAHSGEEDIPPAASLGVLDSPAALLPVLGRALLPVDSIFQPKTFAILQHN